MIEHTFPTQLSWQGSTGAGIRGYSRNHRASAAGIELELSADRHFRGDPDHLNPEQLLVLAASSCQMLSFLGAAARAGVDVRSYDDEAVGTLPVRREPTGLSEITLRPRIVVAPGTDRPQVDELLEEGHRVCFIANSLTTRITVEADVRVGEDRPDDADGA